MLSLTLVCYLAIASGVVSYTNNDIFSPQPGRPVKPSRGAAEWVEGSLDADAFSEELM